MQSIIYPAIFHPDEDGKYFVTFLDLEGCLTGGDSLDEAIKMAGDALFAWFSVEDITVKRPVPTPLNELKAEDGAVILLVEAVQYVK